MSNFKKYSLNSITQNSNTKSKHHSETLNSRKQELKKKALILKIQLLIVTFISIFIFRISDWYISEKICFIIFAITFVDLLIMALRKVYNKF